MSSVIFTGPGAGAPVGGMASSEGRIVPSEERFYRVAMTLVPGEERIFQVGAARVFYMDTGPTLGADDIEISFDDCFPFFLVHRAIYLNLPFAVSRLRVRNNSIVTTYNLSFIVSGNPKLYIFQGFT
jgi:hypothetical protein